MHITDEKKVDVLIEALKERYSSMHKIRDRVQGTGLWALGILLGVAGWLLQSDTFFPTEEKILMLLATAATFYILRFEYLADLHRGFRSQQRVAVKLEDSLQFFTPGAYGTDESLYEEKWKNAGTKHGEGRFFKTTHALLYVGFSFVVFAILLSGIFSADRGTFHVHEHSQWFVGR